MMFFFSLYSSMDHKPLCDIKENVFEILNYQVSRKIIKHFFEIKKQTLQSIN